MNNFISGISVSHASIFFAIFQMMNLILILIPTEKYPALMQVFSCQCSICMQCIIVNRYFASGTIFTISLSVCFQIMVFSSLLGKRRNSLSLTHHLLCMMMITNARTHPILRIRKGQASISGILQVFNLRIF